MENLILNSCWREGDRGEPEYFSRIGPITYDHFLLNGNRTCSVTITKESQSKTAKDCYDLPIDVANKRAIVWGYTIRAIEAKNICLVADFYDEHQNLIESKKKDITTEIGYEFKFVLGHFMIPNRAKQVNLSLELEGEVTACTYCMPTAHFA